jgi:hypothetical protein
MWLTIKGFFFATHKVASSDNSTSQGECATMHNLKECHVGISDSSRRLGLGAGAVDVGGEGDGGG